MTEANPDDVLNIVLSTYHTGLAVAIVALLCALTAWLRDRKNYEKERWCGLTVIIALPVMLLNLFHSSHRLNLWACLVMLLGAATTFVVRLVLMRRFYGSMRSTRTVRRGMGNVYQYQIPRVLYLRAAYNVVFAAFLVEAANFWLYMDLTFAYPRTTVWASRLLGASLLLLGVSVWTFAVYGPRARKATPANPQPGPAAVITRQDEETAV